MRHPTRGSPYWKRQKYFSEKGFDFSGTFASQKQREAL